MIVREAPGYGIAALFAKRAAIRQTRQIFTAKNTAIGVLKTVHSGAAIKVRCFFHQIVALFARESGAIFTPFF